MKVRGGGAGVREYYCLCSRLVKFGGWRIFVSAIKSIEYNTLKDKLIELWSTLWFLRFVIHNSVCVYGLLVSFGKLEESGFLEIFL